jgi:type I restriction enzyme M protein
VFKDESGFAKIATIEEVAAREHSLSIPLYVKRAAANGVAAEPKSLRSGWDEWEKSGRRSCCFPGSPLRRVERAV